MKKLLFTLVLALVSVTSAFAQFEKGKKYIGFNLSGLDLSYNSTKNFSLGLGVNGGYMIKQDWMLMGDIGLNVSFKDVQEFHLGAKCRYTVEQIGLFVQAGVQYVFDRQYKTDGWSGNDFQLTPTIGYTWFLTKNLTLEPSVYYNMSFASFSKRSTVGLAVGLGYWF